MGQVEANWSLGAMSWPIRALLLVTVTMIAGCAFPSSRELGTPGPIRDLALAEFKARVGSGESWIVDARPQLFYQLGHVPGALSLPRDGFESAYAVLRPRLEKDRHRPIAVYCSDSDCDDSNTVCLALMKRGYADVAVFHGGWAGWTAAHLPEEKERE